jgi:hypothetical protein
LFVAVYLIDTSALAHRLNSFPLQETPVSVR